jgi:penicillin-binding protein 1A
MAKQRQKQRSPTARFALGIGLSGGVTLGLVALTYLFWALTFDLKSVGHIPERSWVFDMDGRVYSRLYGENRILTEPGKISPWFKKALLAREDARFYDHPGVDLIGIARAFVTNLSHLAIREGGSTITQQLARNSFELGGRTLHRKLLEAFIATRIEASFSKDQILGYYMNRIYFGAGFYGLETAAQAYFGKSAANLTLSEAALLAGLIRSPNRFSPFSNLEGALGERNTVLDRMLELKMISAGDAATAKQQAPRIAMRRASVPQENYAMDALYRELEGLVSRDLIDGGGLRIYTSLEPNLQRAAETTLDRWLTQVEKRPGYRHPKKSDFTADARVAESPTNYLQGAVVAIDNRTGSIRALVGGRDYQESKFNRALQSHRQLGSTFKPFVYAAAFGRGMLPGTAVDDDPIQRGELPRAPDWNPGNSDGQYTGIRPARDGLILSRNTMTIRVGELATLGRVRDLAKAAKLAAEIPDYPSSYLGAFEATLKDVTAAYAALPGFGIQREPYLVERIDDADGNILYQARPAQTRVMPPAVAWMVAQTLRGVIERGTAKSANSLGLQRYAAGKTGTTDDFKDAWFVGFTNSLTCGVWVGFDQPATIQERGYGAALALPIWVKVMENAPRQKFPDGPFPPPEQLVRVQICSISNQLATDACVAAGSAYPIDLPQSVVPSQPCPAHGGQQLGSRDDRDDGFGRRLMRSFRRLFGG